MDELFGLCRVLGIEAERTAVGVSVILAHGPCGIIAFVVALEVAVTIDEIAGGVAEFLQRAKDFRAGGGPVGWSDETLESKLSQKSYGVLIKLRLHVEQERGGVLVARRFFVEDVPERAECD